MDARLIERYRQLCSAIAQHQAVLVELEESSHGPNAICVLLHVDGETVALPVATLLIGETQPFRIDPQHLTRLDPRRN